MGRLQGAAQGAGLARGLTEYQNRKERVAKNQASMTGMMELSMKEDRIGAFTRSIRDSTTHLTADKKGNPTVQWRPEFLTVSGRGPEPGAPDYLKLSSLIFQQALNAGLYPAEYKDFVEAYGKTYSIPNDLTREMLKNTYLNALVKRSTALTNREFGNIAAGSDHQLAIDSSVGEANKGLTQSFTELAPSEFDKTAAQIQALFSDSAPPDFTPKSRAEHDLITQLTYRAAQGDPVAQQTLDNMAEMKKSGSITGGLMGRFGKPSAGERDRARDTMSLMNATSRVKNRATPGQLGTGHQLGLKATKFATRIKDLSVGTLPVGEYMSKGAEWLAKEQGVPPEEAKEMEREFQLVNSDVTMIRTMFRRAWTGVAFRKEEMEDYEKALPTMEKDDYPTLMAKIEHLEGFMWDAQARLVAMMLDGVVTKEQILNKQIPNSIFFDDQYYVTPYSETGGQKGRVEGATGFTGDRVTEVKKQLATAGLTPEQFLDKNGAIPFVDDTDSGGIGGLPKEIGDVLQGLNLGF